MERLALAIQGLGDWQVAQAGLGRSAKSRCLEAVREALQAQGLEIPPAMPTPDNTALANFHALVADPAKWGWTQIHTQENGTLAVPCLVYFDNCGLIDQGTPEERQAGHIAIYDGKIIHANENFPVSNWWMERLVGAYRVSGDRP